MPLLNKALTAIGAVILMAVTDIAIEKVKEQLKPYFKKNKTKCEVCEKRAKKKKKD